MNSRYLRKKS